MFNASLIYLSRLSYLAPPSPPAQVAATFAEVATIITRLESSDTLSAADVALAREMGVETKADKQAAAEKAAVRVFLARTPNITFFFACALFFCFGTGISGSFCLSLNFLTLPSSFPYHASWCRVVPFFSLSQAAAAAAAAEEEEADAPAAGSKATSGDRSKAGSRDGKKTGGAKGKDAKPASPAKKL